MTNIKERAKELAVKAADEPPIYIDDFYYDQQKAEQAYELGYLSGHADAAATITKLREALEDIAERHDTNCEMRFPGEPFGVCECWCETAREALKETKDE